MDPYDEEPPLRRGHRVSREAEIEEAKSAWTKAMYKHQEAANCFTQCLGLTGHPQANKAILLLISKHTKRFEEIRDKLASTKTIKNILIQNGYNISQLNPNINKLNDEIYKDLREQMQNIVSYSLKKIDITLPSQSNNSNLIIHDQSSSTHHKQQITQYLEQCDVRKSVNIKAMKHESTDSKQPDGSTNIAKEKIVLNDNFFNPDHEQQSKKQLIANNQRLCERVKLLEKQLSQQTELINSYQNEICNKVSTMRQSMDHLYNINNPHQNNKNTNTNKNKSGNENSSELKENHDGSNIDHLHKSKGKGGKYDMNISSKEFKDKLNEKVNDERKKYENDKERLRNIHAKQLQELKKKIKDWMDYAKKQEQHAKIYKKQLQIQHAQNKKKKDNVVSPNVLKNNNNNIGIYQRGTLSRAKQNAIPESQEVNQDGDV